LGSQTLPADAPSWKDAIAGRRRGAAAGQRASGAAPLARYSCPAATAAAATTCRPLGRLNSYLPRGAAGLNGPTHARRMGTLG